MSLEEKKLFDILYQKMLLDREKNFSNYINDDNQLKNFEYIERNENLKILVRLFEINCMFNCDIAIIYDDQVLQRLFYKENSNLELIEDEYRRLVVFAKNNSILKILEEGQKSFYDHC